MLIFFFSFFFYVDFFFCFKMIACIQEICGGIEPILLIATFGWVKFCGNFILFVLVDYGGMRFLQYIFL